MITNEALKSDWEETISGCVAIEEVNEMYKLMTSTFIDTFHFLKAETVLTPAQLYTIPGLYI